MIMIRVFCGDFTGYGLLMMRHECFRITFGLDWV